MEGYPEAIMCCGELYHTAEQLVKHKLLFHRDGPETPYPHNMTLKHWRKELMKSIIQGMCVGFHWPDLPDPRPASEMAQLARKLADAMIVEGDKDE